jgi:hypothetical protein
MKDNRFVQPICIDVGLVVRASMLHETVQVLSRKPGSVELSIFLKQKHQVLLVSPYTSWFLVVLFVSLFLVIFLCFSQLFSPIDM